MAKNSNKSQTHARPVEQKNQQRFNHQNVINIILLTLIPKERMKKIETKNKLSTWNIWRMARQSDRCRDGQKAEMLLFLVVCHIFD
jgi:hypothetical protein